MDILSPFERGVVAHLIADWLLQNEWIAINKTRLRHPASWVHASIHALLLSIALGWEAGFVLGCLHLLIDTRLPLTWWQRLIQQRREGPTGEYIAVWADQVVHICCIAGWLVFVEVAFYPEFPSSICGITSSLCSLVCNVAIFIVATFKQFGYDVFPTHTLYARDILSQIQHTTGR